MTKHFRRELEELTRAVLLMGGLAETALNQAVRAFHEHDTELAETVIDGDLELNATELRIEEDVLKILALYQPTARDLRFVLGVFQISNDLERVGDLAVNIAERAMNRESGDERPGSRDLTAMGERVRLMLSASLDAFVNQDLDEANRVLAMDDKVDEMLGEVYDSQRGFVDEGRSTMDQALRFVSTAKYLERIADHATNIAEDVVYMVSGELIKHRR